MAKADFNPSNDPFTRGLIRRKIKQLIGRAGFTRQNEEDLEQEFFVRILQGLRRFDAGQGHRNVFLTTLVERHVATLLRDRRAGKRDHRRISSLNVTIETSDEERIDLAQTISQAELDARRGRHPRSEEELAQLMQDVAQVEANLPDDLRELAVRLKTQSISEVARQVGVPRTSLYESVRKLRRRFERAGLRDYL